MFASWFLCWSSWCPHGGAKCTWQNLELVHIRVDMAKVGSWTSHIAWRMTFVRRIERGACKTKDSDAQVSIWVRIVRENTWVCKHLCLLDSVKRMNACWESMREPSTYSVVKELRALVDRGCYGDCHTLILSGDHCLVACNFYLTTSRYLAPIVRQFVKFCDMPQIKRKHRCTIHEVPYNSESQKKGDGCIIRKVLWHYRKKTSIVT